MNMSICSTDRNIFPKKIILPTSEIEMAQEVAAVILPFSRGDVARAAKRSKDAAKTWKAGQHAPSLLATLSMAQDIPAVRNWLLGMLGVTDQNDPIPDRVSEAVMEALKILAKKDGG